MAKNSNVLSFVFVSYFSSVLQVERMKFCVGFIMHTWFEVVK